jgi:tetratricopeptide (TPR) repeat protein
MRRITFAILLIIISVSAGWSSNFIDYHSALSSVQWLTDDSNTGTTVFPLLRIPSGGKAESMGTAQTAVAADASSILFNPAVSSILDLTELAFLHNNWIADTSIESVMFTTRFDNMGVGAGLKLLYLPFTKYDEWGEPTAKGYPLEAIAALNASYNFFNSYYFNGVSAGLSLKAGYRHIPSEIYTNQSSLSLMGDVGLYSSFNFLKFYSSRERNFSVGAAFKNVGFETLGEPLPTELSAGISYSPIHPIQIAFDFNLPISLDADVTAENWYLAGGFDAAVTDFFSFQGGFNYRGSNPRISVGSTIDLEEAAFNLNYTLDLTTQTGSPDRFSIEVKLKLGDEGRYERVEIVDELYIAGLEAYASGNLKKAIAYWEAALEIDINFTPAEEFIASATRSIDLLERMEELNKVE